MISQWLIFNHADAWSMTFIIAALSLALRGALSFETLGIPFALAFGAWFAFALNDRFDAPYDAQDADKARRNAFAQVRRNSADPAARGTGRTSLDLVLVAAAVVLLAVYLSFGVRGIVTTLVGVGAAWAYSAPPLRLKTRPGFDLFTHAAFVETFPYLAAIALVGAELTAFDAVAWLILALASLSAQLEQQARDYDLDSRLERNFTTVVGLRVNHILLRTASVTLLTAGVLGAVSGVLPAFLWPGLLMTVPMIVHRLIRPAGTPRNERLIRVSMVAGALYITVLVLTFI